MRSLSVLFGQSPFGPLQEHMRSVLAASSLLPQMVDAVLAGDVSAAAEHHDALEAHAAKADSILLELREHLPRKLFLPVDRRDLLQLLRAQNALVSCARDIAERLTERRWTAPEDTHAAIRALATASADVVAASARAMEHLDELVEVGFAGPEADVVRQRIDSVAHLEDVDRVATRTARAAFFAHEADLPALDVMLWLELLSKLGHLASLSKAASSQLRLLIAH